MMHYIAWNRASMPTLWRIAGLKIQIFADDHNPPHFHLVTADHEAMVGIETLTVLRGSILRRDLETALGWVRENRAAVWAEWERLNGR